ncbi:hypothetical protein ACB098_09G126200 [Castanea mollissima]
MDLKHQPKELMQQAEPSVSCDNVNATLREEEATVTTGTLNEFTNGGQAHREENTDVIPVNQRQAEEGFHQVVSGQQIADPPQEPVWALNIDGEGTSGDETNKSIVFNYSRRLRRRESYHTYPVLPPLLRRKRVPWTAEEEERLKEGVQKFTNPNDSNIPWKNILEFGGNVFQSDRTTIDLKDKWRNMCKRSPKSKR